MQFFLEVSMMSVPLSIAETILYKAEKSHIVWTFCPFKFKLIMAEHWNIFMNSRVACCICDLRLVAWDICDLRLSGSSYCYVYFLFGAFRQHPIQNQGILHCAFYTCKATYMPILSCACFFDNFFLFPKESLLLHMFISDSPHHAPLYPTMSRSCSCGHTTSHFDKDLVRARK